MVQQNRENKSLTIIISILSGVIMLLVAYLVQNNRSETDKSIANMERRIDKLERELEQLRGMYYRFDNTTKPDNTDYPFERPDSLTPKVLVFNAKTKSYALVAQ